MNAQDFELPELPPVCLSCGCRGQLRPRQVKYKYTSGGALTALALLVGFIYYREMTYTLELPICESCVGHRRRKTWVMVLMWPAMLGLLMLATNYAIEAPELFALPVIFLFACLIYAYVLQSKSQPKTARINNDLLVIKVPGYGEVTLFDRHAPPRAQAGWQQQPAAPAASHARPRTRPDATGLNRSVCAECGFINFVSAVECKKCRAPLGAAVGV